jgi:pSer/pThr/pTyr-binding forkhead associated (FHA) protein
MGMFSELKKKEEDGVVDANANKTQPLEKVEPVTGIDDVVADQTGVGKQEPPPVEPRHVRTEAMDSLKLRAQVVRDHVFELKAEPWMELATDGKLQARYQALLLAIRSVMADGGLTPEEAASLLNEAMAERQFALVSMKLGLDIHVRDGAQLFDEMFVADLRKIPSTPLMVIESMKGALQSLKDSTDCGETLVGEVQERINDLILICNLELAKLEHLNKGADEIIAAPKPASTPPAPAQELTGKTHDTPDAVRAALTAEVDAVLDTLPADPGAPTVAAQASPATGPLEDLEADEVRTGIMPASDNSITRATPIPPPRSDIDLASPEDVVSMDAVTTSLRIVNPYDLPPATLVDPAAAMLAATPPAPSAGPTPPEPDADLAFAPTAAQPITPPQGVLATQAPDLHAVDNVVDLEAAAAADPAIAAWINRPALEMVFTVFQGNRLVRTLHLVEPVIKVGKLPSSHLRLNDDKVSRMHAIIETKGHVAEIIDLGSANGTLVNGTRVNKTTLRNNDVLQFGDTIVKLEISQVQAETPASTDSVHTPPLGGMGRDTNVGNPTDVSVAPDSKAPDGAEALAVAASVEPPPEPPTDQTAEQAALFGEAVGAPLDAEMPDSAVIASVISRTLIANRLQLARDFLSDGERLPLTGEINRRVIAFITKYKEALDLKSAPPSPPPSTVPAAPNAFRNSFERAHGALPGQWASPAIPDSAAAQDQAPAPRSEAMTGEAPAVASPAAPPLPFAVIGTGQPNAPAAYPSNVEISSSLIPQAPVAVHSQRNQPTDPPGPVGRSVTEMPTVEENVRRSQQKNRSMLSTVATVGRYVFYGIATLAALSLLVASILFSVNTATTSREVVERTVETSSQAARDTTASTRELLQQLAALHGGNKIPPGAMAGMDGSLTSPRPMTGDPTPAAASPLPTAGMRCRPAPRPACANVAANTAITDQPGPGYQCPASDPPHANQDGTWDGCHCLLCE